MRFSIYQLEFLCEKPDIQPFSHIRKQIYSSTSKRVFAMQSYVLELDLKINTY